MSASKQSLERGRASSALVLGQSSYAVASVDITGSGARRVSGLASREALAWAAYDAAVLGAAVNSGDDIEGDSDALALLDGIASAERRCGSRSLVGPMADMDSPLWESVDEVMGGDWDQAVMPAAEAAALAMERTTEGRILTLAGGVEWQGGCERVKTGSERHSVSRVPRGGIAGSVARYTMRRFGGRLGDDTLRDAAASAVAAMWVHWSGTYLDPMCSCDGGGGDLATDSGVIRALWRIGWRAARRSVVSDSRAGRTGHGADRLPSMSVFDACRPCEGWHCQSGAVSRRAPSVSDLLSLASWAESGAAVLPDAEGVCLHTESQSPPGCEEWRGVPMRDAVRWLAGVLGAPVSGLCLPGGLRRGSIGGRGGLAARQQVRGLAWLLVAGGRSGAARGDDLWARAARFGGYASADSLRASLSAGKVWQRLRASALGRSSLTERWQAARVAAAASVVRVTRSVVDSLPGVRRGTVRAGVGRLAWRVAAAQAVSAGRMVRGVAADRASWRRLSTARRGAARAVKLALSEPLPRVKRAVGRKLADVAGVQLEAHVNARAARARAVRGLVSMRAARAAHWAAVARGVWAGQRARRGRAVAS